MSLVRGSEVFKKVAHDTQFNPEHFYINGVFDGVGFSEFYSEIMNNDSIEVAIVKKQMLEWVSAQTCVGGELNYF